ncbi:dipeptidase [Sediminivirga luteola]|uniref:dipeptidase n=1 Tax=Sediminivirga luteola TaxID=1774748 RepID=UPI001F59D4AB|nr:membrane dipeptidase [Sediminivirga luteola]MCI2265160.1 dipeptidase [Sediminivirga luteola]
MTQSTDHRSKAELRLERWNGYRPYEYLPDDAMTRFEFAPQIGREPGASIVWDPAVEERARAFEESHTIVSAHDHLSLRPADPSDFAAYRRQGREATPYEGIARSNVDVFFDGGPAAVSMIRSHAPFDWDDAVADLAMRQSDWAHQGLVRTVKTFGEATARTPDQVGVVLTLEAATPIGNDLDRLDVLYGMGLRLCGVVYSESNQLGSGLAESGDAGLTALGKRAVRRMNELGIMIDVSHSGDQTALDAVRYSSQPVSITHAGSRALWPTARMKPDDVIRAVAQSGGIIGVEAAPHTTVSPQHPRHSLDSVMDHIEYCIELVGIDHVAFGPDTNYGDHVAWHHTFAPLFGKDDGGAEPLPPHEEVPYVTGCENPTEATGNMIRWLFSKGYREDEIAKLAGGNMLRVAADVWR